MQWYSCIVKPLKYLGAQYFDWRIHCSILSRGRIIVGYRSDNGTPQQHTTLHTHNLAPFFQAANMPTRGNLILLLNNWSSFPNFPTPALAPFPLQARVLKLEQGQNTCGPRVPLTALALFQQGGKEHEKWAEQESFIRASNAVLCLYPLLWPL